MGRIGQKGGGRKSAYQEKLDADWLNDVLKGKVSLKKVQPKQIKVKTKTLDPETNKIITGYKMVEMFKSGKDALAYHILNGNLTALNKTLDKLIATKTDITTDGEKVDGGYVLMPPKAKD